MKQESEQNALPKSARGLCLLLFALAWLQIGYASHQFEHVAGDVTGACVVCTQLDRLDAAAFHEPAEAFSGAAVPVALASRQDAVLPAAVRRYESRAPPAT